MDQNEIRVRKNLSNFKIILSLIGAVTGILTIVFAILALANVVDQQTTTTRMFCILLGVSFLLTGFIFTLLSLIKEPKSIDIRQVIAGSIAMGVGTFFVITPISENVINTLINYGFTIIIAFIGAALTTKGIISVVKIKESKAKSVFLVIIGVILAVLGILFAILVKDHQNIANVIWIIAGIFCSSLSGVSLVNAIRKKKDIKDKRRGNSNKEDNPAKIDYQIEEKKEENVVAEIEDKSSEKTEEPKQIEGEQK